MDRRTARARPAAGGVIDIVAASGVSARTLYYGFRRRHGVAPIAWLEQRRLERVRAEPAAADPGTTSATDVALRWRFWHLGRFARAYELRFGESPSRTLKRGR
jgi:AraC family transcriptional regulator, ethanolamine operon transcriptional activator